ncbi:ABC transporter permease [Undibacterium parvum]|uniref:FtsX-like permease family protein n=2 Tax=Undibacterium TaxID=401469 RepID=A0A6M4A7G1_9BURK|nr:FtsX-like permease family protein [Undibacterium parvum]AZP12985.1 FtsX-like permease family protein [Undibacterium parvum]QJQ07125.1 FtsX-like permease family protein [Undibacterium piscinae]
MLALKLLLRNWRSGELKLLSASLVLAVAVLSGIAVFTDRLETTMLAQSSSLLGADSVLTGTQAHNAAWALEAERDGIAHTQAVAFESMLYAGDEMALASVKAVAQHYPLRGHLEISQLPFAVQAQDIQQATGIPAEGEAWIDSRLMAGLKIQLGQQIELGELSLKVSQILIREPELFSLAPPVLINLQDLAASKLLQAGSRIEYKWLLASDNIGQLANFVQKLKPRLSPSQTVTDAASVQESLGSVAKNAKKFLLLTAILAVLLAGVAIAIAAQQFSQRHINQVALIKSLGVSASRIRALYFGQLLALGIVASLIGLVFGELIQRAVAASLLQIYKISLGQGRALPYALSFLSGQLCLIFFALPALWFLPTVPPLKILRKELTVNFTQQWLQAALALAAVFSLLVLFSGDLILALLVVAGLIVVVVFSILLSVAFLSFSRYFSANLSGYPRLAFANLLRRKRSNVMQIIVFAIALMSLLSLSIVRTSLMDEWSAKFPKDAANHFLENIPAAEVAAVQALIEQEKLSHEPFHPVVRGRISAVKGIVPDEMMRKKSRTLEFENDFSWSTRLADGNQLVAGQWWDQWRQSRQPGQLPGVSVAAATAKNIGVTVGDRLRFFVAGFEFEAEVASLRQFEESAVKRSFAYLFEPGTLDHLSPTYSTAFFLPPPQTNFLPRLLRAHPSMLLYQLDRFLEQLQNIIKQVSDGVMLILWLTLAAAALVLGSAVMSSIDSRRQESALLRALGSPRELILASLWLEFSLLGLLAGVVAILGAEFILFGLQVLVLKTPLQPHYTYWLAAPLLSAALLGLFGATACRSVLTSAPGLVLRGVN